MIRESVMILAAILSAAASSAERPGNGVEFTPSDSEKIRRIEVDRNKFIRKYPSNSGVMELNLMTVHGRSPTEEGLFIYNVLVHFMIYVTEGSGTFFIDDDEYRVSPGAVVDVPPKTRFAVRGENLKYITVENPAWYSSQHYIVNKQNQISK